MSQKSIKKLLDIAINKPVAIFDKYGKYKKGIVREVNNKQYVIESIERYPKKSRCKISSIHELYIL